MAQQVLSVSEEARARVRRRLAAILAVGYSPLFPGDEAEDVPKFMRSRIQHRIAADHDPITVDKEMPRTIWFDCGTPFTNGLSVFTM